MVKQDLFRRLRLHRIRGLTVLLGLFLALFSVTLMLTNKGEIRKPNLLQPNWRGIVPGKTTQNEVVALMGKPDEVSKCEIWLGDRLPELFRQLQDCLSPFMTYTYKEERDQGKVPAKHQIRFKSQIVAVIIEDTWLSPEESSPWLLRKLVENYGPPERVTWSKRSPYLRAFLFCKYGILIHANDVYASKIVYFEHVALDECLMEFADDVATQDPFPDPNYESRENPWPWLIP